METNCPLKLWVYTFCYNEEKILPYVIEYWKQYAAKVIVYDNGSTDNSLKILSQYSWIEVREFDTENTFDPEKISQYKSFCYADAIGKADYVMVCDIDEVLLPTENLLPELVLAKKDNIQLFQTKYYEIINNELNPKYDSLIHTAEGYYAYPNVNIHKAIVFDPRIKIAFGHNSLTYSTNRNYITKSIITLHLKMISSNILVSRQKHLYLRLNKKYKYQDDALYYGNIKNIGTRLSYFKLLFPYKYRFNKNENYITIFDDIYTMIKNNIKFKDLTWLPTEINHNSESSNKECIFGIPIYKSDLSTTEKASLTQLCKIIQNKFEICLICPEDLNLREYVDIADKYSVKLSTLFCAKQYFMGTASYSYMCETADFYKCFSEYKYLFIYQLDGWIFEDDVQKYLDLDVDYIGSPWNGGSFNLSCDTIGNGGVSLRKVQKFIDVCNSFTPEDYEKDWVKTEDLFFCKTMKAKANFKLPTVQAGSNFSLCGLWGRFMTKYNDGKLPMCLHGWHRDYSSYWKKYINLDEFETTGDIKIVQQPIQPIQKSDYKTRLELIKMRLNKSNKPINIQAPAKIENNKIENKNEITQKTTMSSGYANFYKDLKWETNKQTTTQYSAKPAVSAKKVEEKKIEVKQEIQNNAHINKDNYLYYICESDDMQVHYSNNERIIVTMTTWSKRIGNIPTVLTNILNNTLKPYKIVINLAEEEFKNKEKDFPNNVNEFLNNHKDIIEVYWVKHNTKVWKKVIPTLLRYPNDIIICIDDDWIYPSDMIQTLYNEYIKYNKNYPISGNNCRFFNMNCHCGCGSLTSYKLLNSLNQLYAINEETVKYGSDDIVYSYCAIINSNEYKQSPVKYSTNMKSYNANNAFSAGAGAAERVNIQKTYNSFKVNYEKNKDVVLYNDNKTELFYNIQNGKKIFGKSNINWIYTAIKYNYESDNKKICIVIPIYKEKLTADEEYSLIQLFNIVQYKYDIILVKPFSLNIENYTKLIPYKFNILNCNPAYFKKRNNLYETPYSFMLETAEFYECFVNYEWMFIYQLDGWIFKDNFNYFMNKNYDYYGCVHETVTTAKKGENGNGGVSLRKISAFINNLQSIKKNPIQLDNKIQEDIAFSRYYKNIFNIAPIEFALEFGFQNNCDLLYKHNKNNLPMCVHKYLVYNPTFWKKYIKYPIMPIINNKIVVSMTSYPKRIGNVSKSIELLLTKQTLPPNEIHLWLSIEEFPNKEKDLPIDLLNTIKNHKNVQLHWLEKNTFVHKRHEIFKYAEDNDYVFLLDDDVEYDKKLIETVINCAKNNENTIILYHNYSSHVYQGKHIIYTPDSKNIMNKKEINKFRWCGQSMIPVKIYPKEILSEANQNIRNKVSPISDECWFQPWVVYYDIPLYACTFNWGTDLNNTMNTGINSWSHQKEENGYTRRDNWLNAVLNAYPEIYKKYKKLFNYDN